MIYSQKELELACLTTLIADIKYHNSTELRRFFILSSVFVVTGLTPIYNLILLPLFFNTTGMLLSLKKVEQKEKVLSNYIKSYIAYTVKCA